MTLFTAKPVLCWLPPVVGVNGSNSKVSKVTMVNRQALPPLQVNEKGKPVLQDTCTTTSRREMIHLTAASLGFLSLLLPQSAKAGTINASIMQKFMEKLEELGQMAGFSKPKDEDEKNSKPKINETEEKPMDEEEKISKPKLNGTEEKSPKPTDDGEEKKPEPTTQQSTAAEQPEEETSLTALPNLLNDTKTVETTLP